MKKVLLGISGGIDSSVSGLLLKKAGFKVVGCYLKLNKNQNKSLPEAKKAAKALKIKLLEIDMEKEFQKKIINYFISEYKKGGTPNPCVLCNSKIKFNKLLEVAKKKNFDFVATGHYAKNYQKDFQKPKSILFRGQNMHKDQSYFLWNLPKKWLNQILFPLGNFKKSKVYEIASNNNLPSAQIKESKETCFIATKKLQNYLKKYIKSKPGNIIDSSKNIIGKHQGLEYYTIGQRQNLPEIKNLYPDSLPRYVIKKDFQKNQLVLGRNKEVFGKKLIAADLNLFIKIEEIIGLSKKSKIQAQIRYQHSARKVILSKAGDNLEVVFSQKQRAIAPGQSIVFYQNKKVLGGGIIELL